MNYVVLNDQEIFDNVIIEKFNQVDLYGNERVDAVFCHITKQILEDINREPERRDEILPEAWLLRDAGIFVLSKIDRNILYDENTELVETMLGLFDQEGCYIEIRGYNRPESYNQIDQFVIAYRKSLGFVDNLLPEKIENIEKKDVISVILHNIKHKLL